MLHGPKEVSDRDRCYRPSSRMRARTYVRCTYMLHADEHVRRHNRACACEKTFSYTNVYIHVKTTKIHVRRSALNTATVNGQRVTHALKLKDKTNEVLS